MFIMSLSLLEIELLKSNNYFHCFAVFREESTPKAAEPEKEGAHLHPSPDPSFSNSPDPVELGQQSPQGE